jgi:hypothetical protein
MAPGRQEILGSIFKVWIVFLSMLLKIPLATTGLFCGTMTIHASKGYADRGSDQILYLALSAPIPGLRAASSSEDDSPKEVPEAMDEDQIGYRRRMAAKSLFTGENAQKD